ncbi:MAG: hypothetical protein PUF51_02355, partial [Bifidobacteriaceae bacterium]|nr:hypothetical protein [Bifidobacteriaceae bacterium]
MVLPWDFPDKARRRSQAWRWKHGICRQSGDAVNGDRVAAGGGILRKERNMMLKEYTTPLKAPIDADRNVFDLLADRAQRTPDQTIVAYRGDDGEWTGFTATQFRDLVVSIAKGLIAKGLMP